MTECNFEKTPYWWCSAREYVLPEPTAIFKTSRRSNNWCVTLILPTGTCTLAIILVLKSNHTFMAYLDPKIVFLDTENKRLSGNPSRCCSYNNKHCEAATRNGTTKNDRDSICLKSKGQRFSCAWVPHPGLLPHRNQCCRFSRNIS